MGASSLASQGKQQARYNSRLAQLGSCHAAWHHTFVQIEGRSSLQSFNYLMSSLGSSNTIGFLVHQSWILPGALLVGASFPMGCQAEAFLQESKPLLSSAYCSTGCNKARAWYIGARNFAERETGNATRQIIGEELSPHCPMVLLIPFKWLAQVEF